MKTLKSVCILTAAMLVSGCSVDCDLPPDASLRPFPKVHAYVKECTSNKTEHPGIKI